MSFFEKISRNDIYYIIVPIIIAVFPYIIKTFTNEKQWKYIKERSSSDSVLSYFTKMILSGMVFLLLYVILSFAFIVVLDIEFDMSLFKKIYVVWFSVCYGCIFFGKKQSELLVDFNCEIKNKDAIKSLICKLPIIFSLIVWTGVIFEATILFWRITVILMIVYEILIMIILNGKRKSKYNQINFHFYNKTIVEGIDVNNVQQKGDWIIAKGIGENIEYRFRIKDIQKIEYNM